MALSTLALMGAFLAQSPAPLPADVTPLTKRTFSIPITIEEKRRPEIRQLILFVSDDQGQTWNQVVTCTPDKTSFPFTAPHDGIYWFSVGVVDQAGKQQPESPYTVAPALKVQVDTATPVIKIASAERQGDEVAVSWEILEERPDLGSLRLEYRPADAPSFGSWTSVPLTGPGLTGRVQFRPSTSVALTVRMEIKDQTGNVGTAQREVAAGPTAVTAPKPPASPGAAAPSTPATYPGSVASALDRQSASLPPNPIGRDAMPPEHSNYSPSPPAPPPPYSAAGAAPLPTAGSEMRAIAYSGPADGGTAGAIAVPPFRGSLPKAQLVSDPHVSVDYKVSKFGASGVGKAELWVTRDEGVTWQYLTDDPEVAGRDPNQPHRLTATLPGEGVFGLRLVTQSGAGLGREPPRSGDVPELRIEVDTTPPLVKLFEPRPDPLQRDTLILSWSAQDRNLAAKPITLEYAEQRDGPWHPIAAELPNTGSYNWQVPKNVPYQAYLRVSAVDQAGNRSTAQAQEASLIDLNKPEGHLLGVVVQPRTPAPARPAEDKPAAENRPAPAPSPRGQFDLNN